MLVMCTSASLMPDRAEHLVEQLTGAADEGLAFEILLAPRRLADDHQVAALGAAVEAQVLGRRLQTAAVEAAKHGAEFGERARPIEVDARLCAACGGRAGRELARRLGNWCDRATRAPVALVRPRACSLRQPQPRRRKNWLASENCAPGATLAAAPASRADAPPARHRRPSPRTRRGCGRRALRVVSSALMAGTI